MKRLMISCVALAALAAPAFAEQPDGTYTIKDNHNTSIENALGFNSSAITQNGQFVSGNCEPFCQIPDQTTTPGSRADLVQIDLAKSGRGRDK
jgi:hypothetical protein